MFLQKKGTSWSGDLLRDELFHAGIRHSRKRLCGLACPGREANDGEAVVSALQVCTVTPESGSASH